VALYTLKVADLLLTRAHGDKSPLAKRLRGAAAPLGDTRMALRLFGLLPTVATVLAENTETDPWLRRLADVCEGLIE
jgi:hypothetical protein